VTGGSGGSGVNRQNRTPAAEPVRAGKYARVERERRFLLAGPPPATAVTARWHITDRYLPRTRLRLRRVEHPDSGASEFKLTQKVPAGRPGYVQGLITNTYLSAAEYELLAGLPARVLSKTRLSVPPLGIDIFDPPLHGLVLAESEFSTDEEAEEFLPPEATITEVTDDARFTGGNLARTRRPDLLAWLAGYGITLDQTE
jgi:CYTH domain-containing protein